VASRKPSPSRNRAAITISVHHTLGCLGRLLWNNPWLWDDNLIVLTMHCRITSTQYAAALFLNHFACPNGWPIVARETESTAASWTRPPDRLSRLMIEVREFASTVMQRLQLVRSAEGLHPKLVDGKVHERICYKFGGGAKPRSTAE